MQENEENNLNTESTYFDSQENAAVNDENLLNTEEDSTIVELGQNDDFSGLNKDEIIKKLEEILASEDALKMSLQVRALRDAFSELVKSENEALKSKYLEEGGTEEDFEPKKDLQAEKFDKLSNQFQKKKSESKAQKEKQIIENTATKKLIIQELKEMMMGEENIAKAYQKFQALQSKWRSVGAVSPAEANNLWQNYQFCVSQFFDVMKISKDLRELDQKKNLELKIELCEKAEKLSQEKSLRKAAEELKTLQNQWKEIGNVGKEANESIWERFRNASDQLYTRLRENQAKVREQQLQNLAAKKSICDILENETQTIYNSISDWNKATERINELWNQWQKIGHTPKEDKDATWNRFKQIKQKFYDQKEAYFAALHEVQNKNLAMKTALCEKAESLVDNKDWSATTEAYKKIQQEWKAIGPVSRKHSDKIWNRFRMACDLFFENKNKNFAERDAALIENHSKKMEVISKFDHLQIQDDNKANLDAVKALQQEFNSIGEVPYKLFESLQNAYRKAVNEYMAKIKDKKGADDRSFYQLKYEQLQQSTQGKEEMQKERYQLQDKIKKVQAEINQLENNLGFFGKSKNADAMKAEFETKIVRLKEDLNKLKGHLKLIPMGS